MSDFDLLEPTTDDLEPGGFGPKHPNQGDDGDDE
jgi:hypothetical protein